MKSREADHGRPVIALAAAPYVLCQRWLEVVRPHWGSD